MRPAALTTEWVSFGTGRADSTEAGGSDIIRDCNETERSRPLSGKNERSDVLNHCVRQLIRIAVVAWRTSTREEDSAGFDATA